MESSDLMRMSQGKLQEIGVGIAILENHRILLTRRWDFPVWCLPGGHLLPHETILEAAVREAKEETGLVVKMIRLVGLYSLPLKGENGSCEIILQGAVIGGELATLTDETCDARYFALDELPMDLVGWQYHQAWDALSGRSGVLAVLDARLSIRQLRKGEGSAVSSGKPGSMELLRRLCERPNRMDLSEEFDR